LKTAGNKARSPKFQPWALLFGVHQGMIIRFKLNRKNVFGSELNAIFKVLKMNNGSKFGARVSFHTTILQP